MDYREWLKSGVDFSCCPESEFIKEFNKTFDLEITNISYAQYFMLVYLAADKIPSMACFNTLQDYKHGILHYLIKWYNEKMDENEDFYDPDWAEELKAAVREVFNEF